MEMTAICRLIQYRHRTRMADGYAEISRLCTTVGRPCDAVHFRHLAQEVLDKAVADEDLVEFLFLTGVLA